VLQTLYIDASICIWRFNLIVVFFIGCVLARSSYSAVSSFAQPRVNSTSNLVQAHKSCTYHCTTTCLQTPYRPSNVRHPSTHSRTSRITPCSEGGHGMRSRLRHLVRHRVRIRGWGRWRLGLSRSLYERDTFSAFNVSPAAKRTHECPPRVIIGIYWTHIIALKWYHWPVSCLPCSFRLFHPSTHRTFNISPTANCAHERPSEARIGTCWTCFIALTSHHWPLSCFSWSFRRSTFIP